jgi:hypothetical protein
VDEHVYAAIRGCSVKVLHPDLTGSENVRLNAAASAGSISAAHSAGSMEPQFGTDSPILPSFWSRNRR